MTIDQLPLALCRARYARRRETCHCSRKPLAASLDYRKVSGYLLGYFTALPCGFVPAKRTKPAGVSLLRVHRLTCSKLIPFLNNINVRVFTLFVSLFPRVFFLFPRRPRNGTALRCIAFDGDDSFLLLIKRAMVPLSLMPRTQREDII